MKAHVGVHKGVVLFVIDPQNDFLGNADGSPYVERLSRGGYFTAALPVKGAVDAMNRLAAYIYSDADGKGIDDIVVTLDTHEEGAGDDAHKNPDIGHPAYWRNAEGKEPAPMTTVITRLDVENGTWRPYDPGLLKYVLEYLDKVGVQVVWNRHCVDGTWGHRVYTPLAAALGRWEERTGKKVCYVRKGMNTDTEQYGAFEAALTNRYDSRTQFNWEMLDRLRNNPRPKEAAGIATDFCVKTSMEQAVSKLSYDEAQQFTLLTDAMAAVNLEGTGKVGDDFIINMKSKGLSISTCARALA